TVMGFHAYEGFTTGSSNVAIGDFTLGVDSSGSQNVAIGESAMGSNRSGGTNVSVGAGSMDQHKRGNDNVAVGFWAGRGDTAYNRNTYIGREAGYNNNRDDIVAVGYQALFNNSNGASVFEGLDNTAIGTQALSQSTKGSYNVAVGNYSQQQSTSLNGFNTSVGAYTLFDPTTGTGNTVVGSNALPVNTTASQNTAMGTNAMFNTTTGGFNTALGYQSLFSNIGGRSNVAVGSRSGYTNTTGNKLTLIGDSANVAATNLDNASAIGYRAYVGQSNSLVLGSINGVNGATASTDIGIGIIAPDTKFHINEPANLDVNLRVSSVSTGFVPGIELTKGAGGADWKLFNGTGNLLTLARATDDFITTPQNYYEWGVTSYRPTQDNVNSLGLTTQRWTTVYATVGAINTSDARDKENIANLDYGLNEIMKLRPVSFNWKENPQWGKKIGFIAQEVQPILTEVVQVGSLKSKSDFKDDNKALNANTDKLGIYYSDIIPVAVKAIQEQQKQIEELKKQNELLLKRLEKLEKPGNK
ncbi:MAG: tail fiber domain-containing protein, partial [Ferruginibacter sp.]